MAGSGLIAIKRRIKSITSTQKITKAMGLVATAKLRKTRVKLEFLDSFYNSFNMTMEEVLDNEHGYDLFKSGNGVERKLYIVLTSDSGLCGGFNGNILKKAEEYLKHNTKDNIIIVAGQKGSSYFNKSDYEVKTEYVNVADVPSLKDVNEISNTALKMYLDGEIGEVNVLYTEFVSSAKQEIRIEKVLPLGKSKNAEDDDDFELYNGKYVEFEPKTDTLLHSIINLYLKESILKFMTHSKTSEQAIRMSSMDGATKNASDLLENLKLKYNRMRQGAITQEISEIVGGSEAQK